MGQLTEKLKLAITRWERRDPENFPSCAAVIEQTYTERNHSHPKTPLNDLEKAAQMAALLKVYLTDPTQDPTGEKTRAFTLALQQFDIETGKFPDNIDPHTGKIIE